MGMQDAALEKILKSFVSSQNLSSFLVVNLLEVFYNM